MKKHLLAVVKYALFVGLAAVLFWYVYRNQDFEAILANLSGANFFWVGLSVFLSLVSHLSRGWRWAVSLRPLQWHPSVFNTYLAVMSGYFANLLVPRMGEFARCGVLNRTEKVPVEISFGAVVTERALDFVVLVLLTVFTVVLEFDRIGGFLTKAIADSPDGLALKAGLLGGVAFLGLATLVLAYRFRARLLKIPLLARFATLLAGLKSGLLSILRLSKKDRITYIAHTANIWLMYFLMTYVLFFSTETTSGLGAACGLTAFIMGGIGIVVPTPAGVGSYHFFVTAGLMAYGLSETEAAGFAFLMHTSQALSLFVFGGISLLASLWISFRQGNPKASAPMTEKLAE